ncbi:MAG TPA: prolipoprotein diacylglyceryl transferase [Lachnospiraceae bacterium]|nr:prolipoprotein diacylglyceryl transferase [Lachnospiraceae bacterium]
MDIMGAKDIAFPNLGIYLKNVPKGFTVFGFPIALYGVIIGIGVMAGFALWLNQAKLEGHDPDIYWDFSIYAIIFSIIGARIYYVALSWDYYKTDLLSVFNIRGGGLAIYGAVIAAFLTCAIYTKIKKIKMFQLTDVGVTGLILGQIIGRWANFMNREAFGEYSDGLFSMRLPIEAVRGSDISTSIATHITEGANYIQVHPTFLYESVWNVIILAIMLLYRKHKKFQGEITLIYLGGYGLGRFFVEGIRTDQLRFMNTNIAASQVLGMFLFILSIIIEIIVRVNDKKKKEVVKTSKK